uniref:Plastid-encoded RNA polymerase subunit alpha n=1 Tax=Polytomella parva TaxID=51329 RepID=A0A7S0YLZ4_9CHLO|mmetsp:Transcript_27916/g.51588  ORF Transcript_27916/g.51588 Transcript_27916/m.51588 type:complete len:357 (+) Transcript_27916:102-1172(+)|eukprot:CAMPEP_0175073086 /NCGR_PEP_ID=MMETSP0052_2-20121109/20328_1 /TAXON_ID=51329 ORGANISM="Polytomella parva, Strain SAG 63-3" /NCGR_SAMPLE_ID=MMETSP0052_2 /ASSEMBLY_ACC=CAM_ASM_000194 /LENGTH=356 /DNA_ID=CAMNT_0016340779 /DNA_START=46 /DNA_END=1116 /DNA_ORIENTATION=+
MGSKKDKSNKKGKLPEHLENQKDFMTCGPDVNFHVNTLTSANMFRSVGYDNSWNYEDFKENFQIEINRLEEDVIEFDMIGIDPAIANSLRRILIAEIPTIAIEHVFMVNNTSIIQDEVFAHRLGLVPLKIDPKLLVRRAPEEAAAEMNTIVFKLDVVCKRQGDIVTNDKVYSSQLKWLPMGSEMPDETGCRFASGQAHMFPIEADHPRPVHSDILLAKMRPGQCIQLEAHCTKGCGKEHAKWSPVSTAWYRLHPEVVKLKEPSAEVAAELVSECPGLFEIVEGQLVVHEARKHEKVLERLRRLLENEAVNEAIAYRKRKDHFIFTVESSGILPPAELLKQALQILEAKADRLKNCL